MLRLLPYLRTISESRFYRAKATVIQRAYRARRARDAEREAANTIQRFFARHVAPRVRAREQASWWQWVRSVTFL